MTRPLAAVPHLWNADSATLSAWHDRITDLLAANMADDIVKLVARWIRESHAAGEEYDRVQVGLEQEDGDESSWVFVSFFNKDKRVARDMEAVSAEGITDSVLRTGGDLAARAKIWQPLDHITLATPANAVERCLAQWPQVAPNEVWVQEVPQDEPPSSLSDPFEDLNQARLTLMVLGFNQILAHLPEGVEMRVSNLSKSPDVLGRIEWCFGEGATLYDRNGYVLQGPADLLQAMDPVVGPWTKAALTSCWTDTAADFIAVVSGHAQRTSPGDAGTPSFPWTVQTKDKCLTQLLAHFAPSSVAQRDAFCLRHSVPVSAGTGLQEARRPRL